MRKESERDGTEVRMRGDRETEKIMVTDEGKANRR